MNSRMLILATHATILGREWRMITIGPCSGCGATLVRKFTSEFFRHRGSCPNGEKDAALL